VAAEAAAAVAAGAGWGPINDVGPAAPAAAVTAAVVSAAGIAPGMAADGVAAAVAGVGAGGGPSPTFGSRASVTVVPAAAAPEVAAVLLAPASVPATTHKMKEQFALVLGNLNHLLVLGPKFCLAPQPKSPCRPVPLPVLLLRRAPHIHTPAAAAAAVCKGPA
jgi:hypothetical protein